jgi:hypothetical protein
MSWFPAHLAASMLALLATAPAGAQAVAAPPEVRQLVTFLFQLGRATEATTVYERSLLPIYRDMTELRRFRAFREAESPDPLDLVIVSSYAGMEGMERASPGLRRAGGDGRTALQWYGVLAAMSQQHRDEFVEMLPGLTDIPHDTSGLIAFEYLQVIPGGAAEFERAIRSERGRVARGPHAAVKWSETGRFLVADRWTHLRTHGLHGLSDWERYLERRRREAPESERLVAGRKVLLLRAVPSLAIR